MTQLPTTSIGNARYEWCRERPGKQAAIELIKTLELPIGVRAIPLSKGLYTLVDETDYEYLNQWNWYARSGDGCVYASRSNSKAKIAINMHVVLLPAPDGKEPDHIDGDSLNNRRNNLRLVTHQENMWNRKPVTGSSSKFKGVSWQTATQYWKAYIKINEKQVHLGCFWDEVDAAIAYNKAAKALHGEFAKLNKVEDRPCLTQIVR